MRKKTAFTLAELIVVMAIIGILILFAAPQFLKYTQVAHNRAIESNMRNIIYEISTKYLSATQEITTKKLQDIVDSMNINTEDTKYSIELNDDMLIITYKSDSARYSGFMGSATKPTQPSQIGSNLNNGTLLSTVYFAYAVPLNDL